MESLIKIIFLNQFTKCLFKRRKSKEEKENEIRLEWYRFDFPYECFKNAFFEEDERDEENKIEVLMKKILHKTLNENNIFYEEIKGKLPRLRSIFNGWEIYYDSGCIDDNPHFDIKASNREEALNAIEKYRLGIEILVLPKNLNVPQGLTIDDIKDWY